MNAELQAWAYLSRVAEAPCAEIVALVGRVGAVEAAERVRRGAVSDRLARLTGSRREVDCAASDLEHIERTCGRLVTPDDPDWPFLAFTGFGGFDLKRSPSAVAPLCLWTVGPLGLADLGSRTAAIVGTRASTSYGEHVAADLASGLCEKDVAVISGAAFGIDGAAHRAALAVDGLTVAVVAGGCDVPYPMGHSALLHRIAKEGLVVSEYPPGIRPARHRFLVRNRLVAALAGAVVVVEAGVRSGAANTAAWARGLGHSVCAVPGPVTSAASVGCHELLRNGAELVTRAEDVVEIVGSMGELAEERAHPTSELDALTDGEKRAFEALPGRGSRTIAELALESGLPVAELQGDLAMLELAGLAVQQDGHWRVSKAHRKPPAQQLPSV